MQELNKFGLHEKNPFRSLNFTSGIISSLWSSKRLYFWQRSKTADQFKRSYKLAFNFGMGSEYIRDAVNQMIRVYRAPNLKIIQLDSFKNVLKAWTRVSKKDVMISCRPGSPERQIEHALWLTPGIRLGDAVLATLTTMLIPLSSYLLSKEPDIAEVTSLLAISPFIYFAQKELRSEKRIQSNTIRKLQRTIDTCVVEIWKNNRLPGIIKNDGVYGDSEALQASIATIADLLQFGANQISDIYFHNVDPPPPE